jgi:hypothetical protein
MLNDPNMRPNGDGHRERELGSPSRLSGQHAMPLADREVPIATSSPFEAMHRWLDGELSEAEAARDAESARYVELWRSGGRATERGASVRAPADLSARIMAALPGATMASQPQRVVESPMAASPVAAASVTREVAPTAAAPSTSSSTWWQRPIELNPTTAMAAAAGLVALGLAVGAAMKGQ